MINIIFFAIFVIIGALIIAIKRELKRNRADIRLLEKKSKKKDIASANLIRNLMEIIGKRLKFNDEENSQVQRLIKKTFHIKIKDLNEVDIEINNSEAEMTVEYDVEDDEDFEDGNYDIESKLANKK